MSNAYGHAEAVLRAAEAAEARRLARVCSDPEVRAILAAREIGQLFRAIKAAGVNYRRIAELVGMSQSEVSEIISGRKVSAYDVLLRIATGLGIPRERMGLAYADRPHPAYDGDELPAPEVDEAVQRRKFLAAVMGTVIPAVWGSSVPQYLLEPFEPLRPAVPTPLPSQLSASDVTALETLIARMRSLARVWGGQADTVRETANRSMRLLTVPASEPLQRRLKMALSEFHAVAGWCCFDVHADDNARHHFDRALRLSADAGDPYGTAYAAYHVGGMTEERGDPNGALQMFQLSQFKLTGVTDDRASALNSWIRAESASALVHLDRTDAARHALSNARAEWNPGDVDSAADMDWLCALIHSDLGDIDTAESFAASSVRLWGQSENRRDSVLAGITFAELHLKAGEPDGLRLAHNAVTGVEQLRSQRARDRLAPLAKALDARPGSDARELARMARKVAATRA